MGKEGSEVMAGLMNTLDDWVQTISRSDFIIESLGWVNQGLGALGVQETYHASPRAFVYTLFFTYFAILISMYWFRSKRRNRLKNELREARAQLKYLQEKLMQMDHHDKPEIRIFMDGAFDLMHYGHMNAFRLGRSLGTHLVVGVNSDESITECKGAPLMNDQERLTMVSSCKFVDAVVPGCPYIMTPEYLEYVIEKYKIDLVVHGDDPCIVDGKDVYASAKAAGKYRSIPRTEGVSTTDIVGRMLLMTKEHHMWQLDPPSSSSSSSSSVSSNNNASNNNQNTDSNSSSSKGDILLSRQSKFLITSRMLKLFSAGVKAPAPGMKVIYIDGAWDMFHPGHVSLLKAAKQRGDFLIVGVHGDRVVNRVLGMNLPLMNLHERVLSVLGCRYVDDVLIDAPYEITSDMLSSLKIAEVLESPETDYGAAARNESLDRYRFVPKEVRHQIEQPCNFSLQNILQRIRRNQDQFQARFERKMNAERQFFETKRTSENGYANGS